jgi:hypothetical protein
VHLTRRRRTARWRRYASGTPRSPPVVPSPRAHLTRRRRTAIWRRHVNGMQRRRHA